MLKLGWLLARLGEPGTATRAFEEALERQPPGGAACSALLGFLRCAMLRHEREDFERCRGQLLALLPVLPSGLQAEASYHIALGHGSFGEGGAALEMADRALALAGERDDDLAWRVREFKADPASAMPLVEPPSERTRHLARQVEQLLGRGRP